VVDKNGSKNRFRTTNTNVLCTSDQPILQRHWIKPSLLKTIGSFFLPYHEVRFSLGEVRVFKLKGYKSSKPSVTTAKEKKSRLQLRIL
jgi:hypothetical protein